jgi:hypothetical protein
MSLIGVPTEEALQAVSERVSGRVAASGLMILFNFIFISSSLWYLSIVDDIKKTVKLK